MKNINPTNTIAWNELKSHFNTIKNVTISDFFLKNVKRFSNFSAIFENQILIDYSKNRIDEKTLNLLLTLANTCGLKEAIQSMFRGEQINRTEERSVLHVALRNRTNKPIKVHGYDIMPNINLVLNKMKKFCNEVITGQWKGYTGRAITDIVNIGIGGSHLGPNMVTEALRPYKNHLLIHYISNVDGTNIVEITKKINPETTLFLISSKTFLTQETMVNAYSARLWFLKASKNEKYINKHFVALSVNKEEVIKFGINTKNMFEFWDWVGGRYSLWSSVGLSIALSLGFENFEKLLNGAYSMDCHFLEKPLNKNLPVILGLIGVWYNNFFGMETEAIFPYDQYMHRFAAYLQQGNMESNGKQVDREGNNINYQTGPIIWGETGTNGQHSFYQLLHQGTKIVPSDFIAPVISHNPIGNHHHYLLSNFFAQTSTLAFGSSFYDTDDETSIKNNNLLYKKQCDFIKSHKLCTGNRPTNSILLRKITPYSLGALIALYEHKIFTQGVIFNIYTFDQWGVELGKKVANVILKELYSSKSTNIYDSSTNGLINCYKSWNF